MIRKVLEMRRNDLVEFLTYISKHFGSISPGGPRLAAGQGDCKAPNC